MPETLLQIGDKIGGMNQIRKASSRLVPRERLAQLPASSGWAGLSQKELGD